MALAVVPKVEIRFGIGAGFGNVLILDSPTDGILGTNVLGSTSTEVVDISTAVTRISTRRGRDRVFDQFTAGRATIQFQDTTGDFNPDNAAGPYFGKILPMCQIRVSATYSGNTYYLFTGFVTAWDWQWQAGVDLGQVTIDATDAFHALNLLDISTVPSAPAGQLTGARLEAILDAAAWPSTLRNIEPGTITCQADDGTSRTALRAAQTVQATEGGAVFIDGTGNVAFYDYTKLGTLSTGTPTVFDDDGTDIAYQTIDVSLDETELANIVTVTRANGTPQTASDADSIERFYRRNLAVSDVLMETDQLALGLANALLNYRKDVVLRVDSIGLDLSQTSNRLLPGLSLDIGDPVTVNRRYAGTTITADLSVQGMAHDITPDRWFTTISTSDRTSAFILNSADFGILGTSRL